MCEGDANLHYVRQGASGSATGADWTNAYTTLPGTLTRGHSYYVADGSYVSYTFDDANSGSTVTQICKATADDHGTDTGWVSTYGDGQAVWAGGLIFRTANWVFDGASGGGPVLGWQSGHGFKVTQTSSVPVIALGAYNAFEATADNVTILHTEMQGSDNVSGGGSLAQDCVANTGSTGMRVAYSYLHNCGRCWFWYDMPNHLIEYNYLGIYNGTADQHSEGFAIYGDTGTSNTIRYNLMRHSESTGMVMWDNEDDSNSVLHFYGNVLYRAAGESWLGGADNGNGIIGSWAFPTEEMHNFFVYNNTFIDTDQTGGVNGTPETLGTQATVFSNNLARNNYFYLIGGNAGGGGPWGTTSHNHFNATTAIGTSTSTSSGDPFVDYVNLDFSLSAPTTAGVDLGSTYNVDMLGNVRGADGTWDRGAIEYVAP